MLGVARTIALSDLVFSHGFPTSYNLKNQAGEALTLAWKIYHRKNKDHALIAEHCTSPILILIKTMLEHPPVDTYRDALKTMVRAQPNLFPGTNSQAEDRQ